MVSSLLLFAAPAHPASCMSREFLVCRRPLVASSREAARDISGFFFVTDSLHPSAWRHPGILMLATCAVLSVTGGMEAQADLSEWPS